MTADEPFVRLVGTDGWASPNTVDDQWASGAASTNLAMLRLSVAADVMAGPITVRWPAAPLIGPTVWRLWLAADQLVAASGMGRFLGARACIVPVAHSWGVVAFSEGLGRAIWIGQPTPDLVIALRKAVSALRRDLRRESRAEE